jgi:cytochrome c biogenesis protein CcmG, thiol:disulfide interchange protein DsbE
MLPEVTLRKRYRSYGVFLTVFLVTAVFATLPARAAQAPAFAVPTQSGTVSLDSLRGKVVLLDFWASWCEPCRKSFPWLRYLQNQYRDQGLVVVGINLDKKRSAAQTFLEKNGAGFTIGFDSTAATAVAYSVKGMPSTFLVDRSGQIVYSHIGYDDKHVDSIESLLPKLLAK